jgi:hypothetical protein
MEKVSAITAAGIAAVMSLALCACTVSPAPVEGALWEHDLSDTLMSCLALAPDTEEIVAAGVFGSVTVLSPDGEAVWTESLDEAAESFLMPPVAAPGGEIILLSESGHLFCWAGAGASRALKWKNLDRTRDTSTPLLVQDGFVYAYYENYGLLAQVSRSTGKTVRELQLSPPGQPDSEDPAGDIVTERVIRAGDTRLFIFTATYDEDAASERVSLEVLDSGLATVSRSTLGTYEAGTSTGGPYPYTMHTLQTIEYPAVKADTAYVWLMKTTVLSASAWESSYVRYAIDAAGGLTQDAEVKTSPATPLSEMGLFTVQDGLADASGRLLMKSMSYVDDAFSIQHALAEAGSMTAELTLDLGLGSGWEIVTNAAGEREDGLWDAGGDYWFACTVGKNNVASETRVFRLATRGLPVGTSTVSANLEATLPSPCVHTNILMLSDGRLVIGTKDGRICCFKTGSPGVDPLALRPVYYQAQTNWGRK